MRSVLLVIVLAVSGCNLLNSLPDGDKGGDNQPSPDQPIVFAEQEYWNELAVRVERGMIPNTDILVLQVDDLKQRGVIKDDSRVAEARRKRVEITGDVASKWSATLRGN